MKVKTSVTLSEELLQEISKLAGRSNRSAIIEEATWRYLRARKREVRDRRDRELIDDRADALNAEAADVLDYQTLE